MIRHVEGDRLPLGEPSGEKSERLGVLSRALVAAGIRAPIRPDIRNDIWVKLWGNLSFNPDLGADRRDAGGDRRAIPAPAPSLAR